MRPTATTHLRQHQLISVLFFLLKQWYNMHRSTSDKQAGISLPILRAFGWWAAGRQIWQGWGYHSETFTRITVITVAREKKKCWSPLQKFSWTQLWSPSIWAQSRCCLSHSLQSNRHPLTYTGLFEISANQDAPGGMCPQWWRMWQGHSCDMGRAVKQKIDRGRGKERDTE